MQRCSAAAMLLHACSADRSMQLRPPATQAVAQPPSAPPSARRPAAAPFHPSSTPPPPFNQRTLASLKSWVGSLSCASSAAALDTLTAPLLMLVSLRTRLPAVTACLNRPLRWRPKPGAFCPTLCTCFTWARIWPSPITSESRPPGAVGGRHVEGRSGWEAG